MESIVIKKNKWYSFHGSGSVCLSVATKTILYFRVTIYCLFEKEKRYASSSAGCRAAT
jgi:hypothetical protein